MATASTPSSCNARITRTAISPRLATRTRLNISGPLNRVERSAVDGLELEEQLTVLDRVRVADVDLVHETHHLGLDLVHQLHRLEDAERLPRCDGVALLDERCRAGCGRAVEGADHRALDPHEGVLSRLDRLVVAGRGSRRRHYGRVGS